MLESRHQRLQGPREISLRLEYGHLSAQQLGVLGAARAELSRVNRVALGHLPKPVNRQVVQQPLPLIEDVMFRALGGGGLEPLPLPLRGLVQLLRVVPHDGRADDGRDERAALDLEQDDVLGPQAGAREDQGTAVDRDERPRGQPGPQVARHGRGERA